MAIFIERIFPQPVGERPGTAPLRVAIKDLIDMVGLPTTAGSRAVAATARPASADAACLAGIRAAEARGDVVIVGKTGLHELAFGVSGINPWYGTPTNPLDPDRIPGGSSSGSAVAVAAGEADVAVGTDTGGSVRIPAACCGVAGLKTTAGRIPVAGVWPLAPTLDTVGPLARDVAGLRVGLALLDAGRAPAGGGASGGGASGGGASGGGASGGGAAAGTTASGGGAPGGAAAGTVARLRLPAQAAIDAGIDAALRAADLDVVDVELPGWAGADAAASVILLTEAWASDGYLIDAGLGDDVADRLRSAASITEAQVAAARALMVTWRAELGEVISRVGPVVLPTLAEEPPLLVDAGRTGAIRLTMPINLAGFPALSLPVPADRFPASLQMVGLPYGEEGLLDLAARIEAAVR